MMFKSIPLFFGLCCFVPSAFAGLIQSTPFEVALNGTGFGNVATLITLQTANGQTNSESGCIGFGNSTSDCGIAADGKIKNSSETQPVPGGITNAADLRFVFNASEPSGNSITLDRLEVSFYGHSSTALFTSSIAAPVTLNSTQTGAGNSGFVFEIAPGDLAAANAALAATMSIGAGFAASNASGGPDTVFLQTALGAPGQSGAPEPASYGLLGLALIVGFVISRRYKREVPAPPRERDLSPMSPLAGNNSSLTPSDRV